MGKAEVQHMYLCNGMNFGSGTYSCEDEINRTGEPDLITSVGLYETD